jgi:nucleotide-binding universal stress UspA family protein
VFRRSAEEPPDPSTLDIRRILLASEGRKIDAKAIDFAAELARRGRARVYVFSIARVWGTSFGFPNPGLMPSHREWDEQRESTSSAVRALERHGLVAQGRVLATRKATRRIVGEAERLNCDAIVMAADPPRRQIVSDFMWSQEPYRVRRRARIPVYLVPAG